MSGTTALLDYWYYWRPDSDRSHEGYPAISRFIFSRAVKSDVVPWLLLCPTFRQMENAYLYHKSEIMGFNRTCYRYRQISHTCDKKYLNWISKPFVIHRKFYICNYASLSLFNLPLLWNISFLRQKIHISFTSMMCSK